METRPMEESIEQSELEATAERRADLRRLTRKEMKSELVIPLAGLVVGLCLSAGGFFFLLQGIVSGLLVFVVGLLAIGVSLLGGLGEGGLRILIARRNRQPGGDAVYKMETLLPSWRDLDKTERDAEERKKKEMSD